MGAFLSLSSVIGIEKDQVAASLQHYLSEAEGGLEPSFYDTENDENLCIVKESGGNTTILYPDRFLQWDETSAYISQQLQAPVFSLHLHDGDLWMYILYVNGEIADQFNPLPDYWEDNLSYEEIVKWKGNAPVVARYVSGVAINDFENYLVRWEREIEQPKAYADDEYGAEGWQLMDFMKKLCLPIPMDDDWEAKPEAAVYRLWTPELPLIETFPKQSSPIVIDETKKPWWQFWK